MSDYQSQVDKPEAAATPSGRGVTAVGRTGPYDVSSPSGTDWNQTFGDNNPASPSGTNWNTTFATTNGQPNPQYIGTPSNAVTRARFAGDTTPPPSPGDIDSTFFGGPTPTPTPTPKPSLAFFRARASNSFSPLTRRDYEMYGAGADFGLT